MPDAPSPPPSSFSLPIRIALAVLGVAGGMGLTLLLLTSLGSRLPPALQPPAPPPAPTTAEAPSFTPAAPPTEAQLQAAWDHLHQLAKTLTSDDGVGRLYTGSPMLQEEYPSAESWKVAVGTLRDRLHDLPVDPPHAGSPWALEVRSRTGDQGGQDIVTLTAADGGRATVFFEGAHPAEFDVR